MMAALTQAREWYRQQQAPLHAAAVQQHRQSTTNSTIANVPVVVGVPKGVNKGDPANTKVLLYMHGERRQGQQQMQCQAACVDCVHCLLQSWCGTPC